MSETQNDRDRDEPTSAPVRLRRLVIEELFGPSSAVIDISFKLEERVTVLHGRNGSGKTITLNLIQALSTGNLSTLHNYPFTKLTIELTDGSALTIRPTERDDPSSQRPQQQYSYIAQIQGNRPEQGILDTSESNQRLLVAIEEETPWLTRIAPNRWIDERTRRPLNDRSVISKYGDDYLAAEVWVAMGNETRDTHANPLLTRLLDRIPKIKHIKADRLFVRGGPQSFSPHQRATQPSLMVERLSQNIRALVSKADRNYRRTSTRLDSSLPTRLFATPSDQQVPTLEELKERSRALQEQAKLLSSLGLLSDESSFVGEEKLREDQKKTFFIILQDQEEKLRPFADVVAKSQRLLDSLNRKLAPKKVLLDVQDGYKIQTADGSDLPLSCLSSGEQHELVLLHELLFEVSPGSLILIDEPELSLHVTWQKDMLEDLLDVAKLSDLDIVVATHSPYIVGERENLMVRLGEPIGEPT